MYSMSSRLLTCLSQGVRSTASVEIDAHPMQSDHPTQHKPPAVVGLRDVQPADLPTLYAFESDPAWCSMALVKPRTAEAFDAVWAKIFHDWSAGITGVVQKTILADGEVCGTIGCRLIEGRWEVGYGLGRTHWGRGIASCALGLLLEEVQQRPLAAHAAASNIASVCVLLKHGFVITAKRPRLEAERTLARDELTLVLA